MIEGGEEEKRQILTDFIQKMDATDKVMVFVGRKARADDISSDLSLIGERENFCWIAISLRDFDATNLMRMMDHLKVQPSAVIIFSSATVYFGKFTLMSHIEVFICKGQRSVFVFLSSFLQDQFSYPYQDMFPKLG